METDEKNLDAPNQSVCEAAYLARNHTVTGVGRKDEDGLAGVNASMAFAVLKGLFVAHKGQERI